MAEQARDGETPLGRLLAEARRALAGRRARPSPARANGPLNMTDIHPQGSCARSWRTTDLSDLFAPEAPKPDGKER